MLGVKIMVGEDDEHAQALALPFHLALVQIMAGQPAPLMSVEQALNHRWTSAEREAEARVDVRADVTGGAAHVASKLAALVRASQAVEIVATTNTFDPLQRLASYQRLAAIAELVAPSSQPLPT